MPEYEPPRLVILRPVLVEGRDGTLIEPAGRRAKSLLVALALARGRVVSRSSLARDIWDGEEPSKAALHTLVSRTRNVCADGVLVTHPSGYRLGIDDGAIDVFQYRALVDKADGTAAAGEFGHALRLLAEAGRLLGTGELDEGLTDVLKSDIDAAIQASRKYATSLELTCLLETGAFDAAEQLAASIIEGARFDETAQAAYLRALHGAGRTAAALEHYRLLDRAMRDELGLAPSNDLAAVQRMLLADDVPRQPGPAASSMVGVRSEPTALIGRDGDIDAVNRLLSSVRLTTILGVGGLGKTRLAHEIGLRAHAAGTPRVVLIALASVRTDEDVVSAFAAALGIRESTMTKRLAQPAVLSDLGSRLADRLREQRTLLIIDNCEHVSDAVARLTADFLGAVADLTVLATSRSPLGIAGEHVYQLGTLGYGPDEGSPATRLFRERALAARPTVKLDDAPVERLCARLDGLPLAIELAAVKVRAMSVEDIERRLDRRFSLLTGSDVSAPARHRTLLAVIDWSWNLLTDAQKSVMRRLARFPAGFSADAARAVAALDDAIDVDAALDALVNQSLLSLTESVDGVRFRMLETVREFGEMALGDAGEDLAVQNAMIDWGAGFALATAGGGLTARQLESSRRMQMEDDNLVTILRWAQEAEDVDAVVCIGAALVGFWMQRGSHTDVASLAGDLLAGTSRYTPKAESVDAAIMMAAISGTVSLLFGGFRDLARARLLIRRCLTSDLPITAHARAMGELVETIPDGARLSAKLALLRGAADVETRGLANILSAHGAENEGAMDDALTYALESHRLAARTENLWLQAMSAQTLAELYSQGARPADALTSSAEAVDILRLFHADSDVLQQRWLQAMSMIAIGDIDGGVGVVDEIVASSGDHDGDTSGGTGMLAATTIAEAELARGHIAEGLAEYRQAAGQAAPPRNSMWWPIMAASAITAHVLYDSDDQEYLAGYVRRFRSRTRAVRRLMPGYVDKPASGMVLLAIGAWLASPPAGNYLAGAGFDAAAIDRIASIGIELVIVAGRMHARQDSPSMNHARHFAKLEADHGVERVSAMYRRHEGTAPNDAVQRADELLADPLLYPIR
ncbi:BTAD domain-containing putative transcriptional regulator [Spelaeicoccus albus]|uniref:Putative ATPase/DNA-binding SARP family transcriptional activator n=1 Tax=Spelaeicoccus albus TaxID=1280376 RepID=A0A7Z0D5F3_9MICO|nr:BTAD domain-containing putative transcriptional regulator [Spelaeicoccus albus]NYI69240.1 putative ATPase/DNA-binding SARP family transcriptional activator [Spelaeicoccus albus]